MLRVPWGRGRWGPRRSDPRDGSTRIDAGVSGLWRARRSRCQRAHRGPRQSDELGLAWTIQSGVTHADVMWVGSTQLGLMVRDPRTRELIQCGPRWGRGRPAGLSCRSGACRRYAHRLISDRRGAATTFVVARIQRADLRFRRPCVDAEPGRPRARMVSAAAEGLRQRAAVYSVRLTGTPGPEADRCLVEGGPIDGVAALTSCCPQHVSGRWRRRQRAAPGGAVERRLPCHPFSARQSAACSAVVTSHRARDVAISSRARRGWPSGPNGHGLRDTMGCAEYRHTARGMQCHHHAVRTYEWHIMASSWARALLCASAADSLACRWRCRLVGLWRPPAKRVWDTNPIAGSNPATSASFLRSVIVGWRAAFVCSHGVRACAPPGQSGRCGPVDI